MKTSLYELVGVPAEAPRDMIGAACRRRIAKLEREGGEGARAEVYAIREAWSILGDDGLRAAYDASLAQARPAAADPLATGLSPEVVAVELLKPRRGWGENWERHRRMVFVVLGVGLFALSAVWSLGNRIAHERRLEAANREAENGEPMPGPRQAKAAEPKAEEPFSAEKFERDLKAREAEIQAQVASEQAAKEEEFRRQLEREGDQPSARRRASRARQY